MSLFSGKPANQDEERKILSVIFDHLDEEDLLRCETVCRQWREVLLSGEPWAILFDRKIVSSSQWRQLWRNFDDDENKLQTVNYRGVCRAIMRELKLIDRNWRTGNFKKTSEKVDSLHNANVVFGFDYIALEDYRGHKSKLKFHHRSSLKLKSFIVIPRGSSATTNAEIAVLWDKKNIKILDSDGQLISEVPELDEDERVSWKLASCCLSGDQMAVLSRTQGQEKLSLWDVRNPPNAICLKSRWYNLNLQLEYSSSMKMDEQFIVVSTSQSNTTSVYFFSMETLGLHWQKTFYGGISGRDLVYHKGMLLLHGEKRRKSEMSDWANIPIEMYDVKSEEDDLVNIYDVKSGQCFRQLPATVVGLHSPVCFNSKFMVVNSIFDNVDKFNIYDLEDVKNPKSEVKELFVHSIEKLGMPSLWVDETEIFICDYNNVMQRLNFGSFECFQNATKSVTLSLPWRSVWRSKGVDEEPLEPVHHMEVYTEVLKYFQQLSMDCQAAIKTYPICDVDFEILDDDFIGYRPKMAIYDENMVIRQQGMNCKTVPINKTTFVSAMGKTIQLIDSTTGNVVKEIRLDRDAINLHFNCNLLVFVCKIREHDHLLSVWRIENSLNLTHVKDVSIGDYDGSLQVDEQFIAIKTGKRAWTEKTFNFISMKTFEVERSVRERAKYLQYDNGYLFVLKEENLIGILDVASGTFLHDISIKPSKNYHMIFRVNSNYVVMTNLDSKLYVYDLKCLRETTAVPTHLLLTTIDLECSVKEMLMNETRIVCLTNNKMFVVDLQPIDRLRCPQSF
jgi:F-box-like